MAATSWIPSPQSLRLAALQLLVTLIVLAFVPGTALKALLLLTFWGLVFWPIGRSETVMFVGVCLFFTGMNASALHQGIFAFREPNVLGMPYYELFMWGFYLLHTKRLFEGDAPRDRRKLVWALALAYAAVFGTVSNQQLLLLLSGTLLLLALWFFHEPLDLAYVGYMVLLGAATEYVGVGVGQWFYPEPVPGGVPPWFVTMWGGIGLFFRRLVLPWVSTSVSVRAVSAS